MKINELLEDRDPSRYVAGRDFEIIPNTEYNGYELGAENAGDSDTNKSTYGVYKHVGENEISYANREINQKEYIRIHDVLDPKRKQVHSPYVKGDEIIPMYKFTVDMLRKGKLKPEKVAVAPAEGPDGDDLGDDRKETEQLLAEKFFLNIGGKPQEVSTVDANYVWMRANPRVEWKVYKKQSSHQEAMAVAKRMRMAVQADVAVGNSKQPLMLPDGTPVNSDFGSQKTDNAQYPNSEMGALQFLKTNSTLNLAGAMAREDRQVPGNWIVRTRTGNVRVDLNNKRFSELNESVRVPKKKVPSQPLTKVN
jgi:hypothetical protein